MSPYCVITSINKPNTCIRELSKRFENIIVIGDKKTPEWKYKHVSFINYKNQGGFHSSIYTPYNHYSRKNIGYLIAIKEQASVIYDTDDDNIPNNNWSIRDISCIAGIIKTKGWYNVYNNFSTNIWPRGLSLEHTQTFNTPETRNYINSPIQQGLADKEPDVDAIWRLIMKRDITFKKDESISLSKGVWCPFNSQSTWWFPQAYHLMYLPVYASFRMTDIWRSFIAQRCLWEMGYSITFHSPSEVYQNRNKHDLLNDFSQEVIGYLNNNRIIKLLSKLKLKSDIHQNMLVCYKEIIQAGILPKQELVSVKAWIKDIKEWNQEFYHK